MKKHNIFITFEGGEGTGKSTVAKMVKARLEEEGQPVFLTREPGGRGFAFAEDIRKIIMNHGDIDPITELLLFNASRREHVTKKIVPQLEKGNLVISDRFSDSTIVYQGIAKGVDKDVILEANNIAVQNNGPSLVFIFDLDPITGMKRISDNNRETNRFDDEGTEFHNKIRDGYLELASTNTDKYIVVDASQTPDEVTEFIINKIKEYENKIN